MFCSPEVALGDSFDACATFVAECALGVVERVPERCHVQHERNDSDERKKRTHELYRASSEKTENPGDEQRHQLFHRLTK